VRETAEVARTAPPAPQPPRLTDILLDGITTRFTEGYVAGLPLLRRALQEFRREARGGAEDVLRWLWLACPVAPEPVAPELWDDETWHELATRAVQLAREAGVLAVLPVALVYRAGVHVHAGQFAAAAALIEEADAITEATGNAPLRYTSSVLAAWRGEEARALELIEAGIQEATARGEGRAIGLAGHVTAVLYNGLGRYEEAMAGARRACEQEDLGFFGWSLVELVEASVRCGARGEADHALQLLEERTLISGTDWALGVRARSRALLSVGDAAEDRYREAIERLERSRIAVHLARAHLAYGEWLRRENRRTDARAQLGAAHKMLSHIGAEAFAERARRELLATGAAARVRTVESREVLTAQEAQIARLACDGRTNPQIGAELFISPRTVEWHLHKVFTKLDVSSRSQLRGALTGAGV
jgi:DNA-binding CsgD family transcriptional regulator/tetratricopeptide (TPR) repeat protein